MLIGQLIDRAPSLRGSSFAASPIVWLLAGVATLIALRGLTRWLQVTWSERLAQSVLADVRFRMFAHLHRVRLNRLQRRDPGRIAARFAGDSASLRSWIAASLVESPTDVLLIVACLIVCAAIHPSLALVALIALLPCVPILLFVDARVRIDTRQARAEQARFTGEVVSTLRDAAAIRRAGSQPAVRRAAIGRLRFIRDTLARRGRREAALRTGVLVAASLACVGVALAGMVLLRDDKITTGRLISATWIASLMVGPLNRLAQAALMRGRSRVARERIAALFALPPEGANSKPPPLPREHARLRFRQLVLPLEGGGRTEPIEATLCGPGVYWLDGPVLACRHLARAVLREETPHSGRLGLNGVKVGRHSRAALRDLIWHVDTESHRWFAHPDAACDAWREAPSLVPERAMIAIRSRPAEHPDRLDPAMRLQAGIAAGIARRCKVMVIELPHGLDGASQRAFDSWLTASAPTRLFIVYGTTPPHGAFELDHVVTIRPMAAEQALLSNRCA